MNWQYEKACKEAGLSEDRIREIRRIFDNDKKKLMRENISIEESHTVRINIHEFGDEGEPLVEIPDTKTNVEDIVIRKMECERFFGLLKGFSRRSAEIYLAYLNPDVDFKHFLANRGIEYKEAKDLIEKMSVYFKHFYF